MKFALLLCSCGYLLGQPLFSIYNAASGLAGGGMAPGALVDAGYLPNSQSPPPALDPATVTLTLYPSSSSRSFNLPVLGPASSITVLALVPANVPLGLATILMSVNGIEQASVQKTVLSASLGLFTKGSIAAAQNVLPDGSVVANALTAPASPTGFVTLWGTGLGSKSANDVTVTVGGKPAIVTYAGHSSMPGLDQINMQIPNDPEIPFGCYVAVEASVSVQDGLSPIQTSNLASISLAPKGAGACTHPLNLTLQEMQTLDAGGAIPLLSAYTESTVAPSPSLGKLFDVTRSDSAAADIPLVDSIEVAGLSGGMLEAPSALFGCHPPATPYFGTEVFHGGLSAGAALNLSGPSGQTLGLEPGGAFYSYLSNVIQSAPASTADAVAGSFFAPGTWTLIGPGGGDVAAFSTPLNLSPAIRIRNTAALVDIDVSQDLTVTWDTQGLLPNQMVTVSLLSTVPCSAPALQGSLVIPSSLIFASGGGLVPTGPGPWLEAQLSMQPGPQPGFRVPLSSGGSMPGVFGEFSSEAITVVLEPFAPAIYPGAIGNQNGTQNTKSNGAAPGSTIGIWATGLSGNVRVTGIVAGETVVPSYAGPAPGLPGEQQVNLTVPADLGPGTTQVSVCRTPVVGSQVCSPPAALTIN